MRVAVLGADVIGVVAQVLEVGEGVGGEVDPPLLHVRGQLFGGPAGQQFGVAVGTGTAQDEEETTRHDDPQMIGVRQ